jgi:hypothetical protein
MPGYREVTPVPGPEAFAEDSRDARLSQAAIVLSAGAAVSGDLQRVAEPEALALPPELARAASDRPVPLEDAVRRLGIDLDTHRGQPDLRLPATTSAELTRDLIDRPTAVTAAALVEANLHSGSRLVRTSAAVAALDTTGPRDDVVARREEGARAPDELTRDLARVGLARVNPQHPALRRVTGREAALPRSPRQSRTAVVTHGTFAARTQWWRPGGAFYEYLDRLAPPLHLHDPSFGWSGIYSDGARQLAATHLVAWTAGYGLQAPDFFAHSHGATVANLATVRGQQFDRLVLLSWPVHQEWFPDFTKVRRILDVRVRMDLVIIADRGGQTFRPPPRYRGKVTSLVNGWFDHSDTNDPAYWERYDLPAHL